MPTIEFVHFETDDEPGLLEHRDTLIALLREEYAEDFISAQLARCDDGSFLELIVWATRATADRVAEAVPADPRAAGFFSRIGAVHRVLHAEVLHQS